MVKALILTGGQSKRMGEQKYLLDVHGMPQYEYLYEMLTGMEVPTLVSCSKVQDPLIHEKYPKLVDAYDSIGPIGGLASAIQKDESHSWLVVACDLFHLTKNGLQGLLNENDEEHDIITYRRKNSDFYETTITLYNPGSFDVVQKAVENEEYSLQRILRTCKVKAIIPTDESFLQNANTPHELG